MKFKEYKNFNNHLSKSDREVLTKMIQSFDTIEGGFGNRNFIKKIIIDKTEINIKSFKIPNYINKVVYNYFRKSKARRSFEYANKLLNLGINTPKPMAYFEYKSLLYFSKSYYCSQQYDYDLTYRELINDHSYSNFEEILRAFTQFTFQLHEKKINFLDHSPGNTLIKKVAGKYEFYLVDLNRMKFHTMNFEQRMKNFAKLSPKDIMLDIMSDEYSKLYKFKSKKEIVKRMYYYSQKFSAYYKRQEAFKRKYYLWRK